MTKLLITAGCSFSEPPNSWTKALSDAMDIKTLFLGHGAGSNGIISKKVIYNTTESLKTYKPNEILVGIMWSGASRSEFYSQVQIESYGSWFHNPLTIVEDKNYYLLNTHWDSIYCDSYYKNLYDMVGSVIKTIEHILNVQWFLKSQNIPYFMTEYYKDVFEREYTLFYKGSYIKIVDHPDVKYLYDLIDFDNWIDAEDCQTWVMKYSNLLFPKENDPHPSYEQHKIYTENVIIPFLKRKNLWEVKKPNQP
jgi:hypothetical protein